MPRHCVLGEIKLFEKNNFHFANSFFIFMSRLLTRREQKQYAKFKLAMIFRCYEDCFLYNDLNRGLRTLMERGLETKTLLDLVRVREIYNRSCKCECVCEGKTRRCPECNPRNL